MNIQSNLRCCDFSLFVEFEQNVKNFKKEEIEDVISAIETENQILNERINRLKWYTINSKVPDERRSHAMRLKNKLMLKVTANKITICDLNYCLNLYTDYMKCQV